MKSDYEQAREAIAGGICSDPHNDISWASALGMADTIRSLKWPDGSPMIGVIASEQAHVSKQVGLWQADMKRSIIRDMTLDGWRKLAEKESE